MHFTQEDILKYGVKLIIIFLVIPIHEYAHAWAATKLGDNTPQYQGRLTLNPLAHVDPIGAICIFFTGFGWGKPVQINPLRFKKYRKGMALTAAAGPIMNILIGLIGIIFFKIVLAISMTHDSEALNWMCIILRYFTLINVGLAAFNLLPVPPLDGSKILGYFLPPKWEKFIADNLLYISLGFLLLLVTGALDRPLGWVENGMFWIMDKLTFWVDIIIKAILN
ncbi:MAG: site-2 protease family protein [Ruminococcus sp.]|nr:site-2 protease family protein [Ruminococcus sp.]